MNYIQIQHALNKSTFVRPWLQIQSDSGSINNIDQETEFGFSVYFNAAVMRDTFQIFFSKVDTKFLIPRYWLSENIYIDICIYIYIYWYIFESQYEGHSVYAYRGIYLWLFFNLSEKCNYNPNLIWFNKIQKMFLLCACEFMNFITIWTEQYISYSLFYAISIFQQVCKFTKCIHIYLIIIY